MANANAADYMVNIIESLAVFKGDPGAEETEFSPGEFLAIRELSAAAPAFIPSNANPCLPIVNPRFNQAVADFAAANSAFGAADFVSFTPGNGPAPRRTTGITYTDGNTGAHYVDQAGNIVLYGAILSDRNGLAGDFNDDGARDWNDADELVAAWEDRNGGPAWQAGTDAIIEVLGDFTGDGNFTDADVRYWADGLAMDPVSGTLNRAEGFTRVDNAFGSARGAVANFFNTTLATGAAYAAGDSRADIAGNLPTRGYNPVGHDGVVDAQDIDYVYANFGDWSDIQQSVFIDLSADMNGDLVVDQDDVCDIVLNVLKTQFGDVTLDGVVDSADRAIAEANLNMPGGWADGDMNGDGFVDSTDLDIIDGVLDPCAAPCPQDLNGDGSVGAGDLAVLVGNWAQVGVQGDFNGDGVGADDLALLIGGWGPCN